MELLYSLPPERRVGKDADLQELLDDTSRLYNYFRDDDTPEMDYAAATEPYWAKIRLPEDAEEEPELDEEEPDEATEPEEEADLQPDVPEQNGYYIYRRRHVLRLPDRRNLPEKRGFCDRTCWKV